MKKDCYLLCPCILLLGLLMYLWSSLGHLSQSGLPKPLSFTPVIGNQSALMQFCNLDFQDKVAPIHWKGQQQMLINQKGNELMGIFEWHLKTFNSMETVWCEAKTDVQLGKQVQSLFFAPFCPQLLFWKIKEKIDFWWVQWTMGGNNKGPDVNLLTKADGEFMRILCFHLILFSSKFTAI